MTDVKETLHPGEFKYKLKYDEVRHILRVTAQFGMLSSREKDTFFETEEYQNPKIHSFLKTEEYQNPKIEEIQIPENSTVRDWYSHENGIVLLPPDNYSVELLIMNVKPEDIAKDVAVFRVSQIRRTHSIGEIKLKQWHTEKDVKEIRISLSNLGDWNTKDMHDLPNGFVLVNNAKSICCNIKDPPTNVQLIQKMILEKTFAAKEYSITNKKNGPTLVTVVNSSRLVADFERDMEASNITECEAANVSIIRIIPALDSTEAVKVYTNAKIKRDFPFLVSQDAKTLFDCSHNTDMQEQLFQYLLKSENNKDQDDGPVLETTSSYVLAIEASKAADAIVTTPRDSDPGEPTDDPGGMAASTTM